MFDYIKVHQGELLSHMIGGLMVHCHVTVNHNFNFVNPDDPSIHIQSVQSFRSHCKRECLYGGRTLFFVKRNIRLLKGELISDKNDLFILFTSFKSDNQKVH